MEKENNKNRDFIERNLNILQGLYDSIRIVDPQKKKVIFYDEGCLVEKETSCFSDLGMSQICENCISIRALKNKRTFMKIENIREKIYLITAVPIEKEGKELVVELTKDVTNCLFYGNSIDSQGCKVNDIIDDMKKLAIKDALTGVYNRRFIDERLSVDMENCAQYNDPISIIMIDIDYFKDINDSFGHTTGDTVLKEFVDILKSSVRNKKDWLARYGGEEFLVCAPGANARTALQIAERMQEGILNKKFKYDNEQVQITASFGICTVTNKNMTMEEFIDCADKKLYKAKNSGRNKIVI